jgi:hypothetical protein
MATERIALTQPIESRNGSFAKDSRAATELFGHARLFSSTANSGVLLKSLKSPCISRFSDFYGLMVGCQLM